MNKKPQKKEKKFNLYSLQRSKESPLQPRVLSAAITENEIRHNTTSLNRNPNATFFSITSRFGTARVGGGAALVRPRGPAPGERASGRAGRVTTTSGCSLGGGLRCSDSVTGGADWANCVEVSTMTMALELSRWSFSGEFSGEWKGSPLSESGEDRKRRGE